MSEEKFIDSADYYLETGKGFEISITQTVRKRRDRSTNRLVVNRCGSGDAPRGKDRPPMINTASKVGKE